MRRPLLFLALILILGLSLPGGVLAESATQLQLLLSHVRAKPGETVWAGLRFQLAPNWHNYWQNAGDSGAPTTVQWDLPPGITAGDILWPVPEKHVEADYTTFVYYREVVLLVPLTLASNLPAGPQPIKAQVHWLECERLCVPAEGTVAGSLEVGDLAQRAAAADVIDAWRQRLPRSPAPLDLKVRWLPPTQANSRILEVDWATKLPVDQVDFFPLTGQGFEVAAAVGKRPLPTGGIQLQLQVTQTAGAWPTVVSGLAIARETPGAPAVGYAVALSPSGDQVKPANGTPAKGWWLLLSKLALAFVGGLILNAMPCVLPVLALKILSFVNQSREAPERVRLFGWLYALGVLVSFLVMAGAVIGVQAAGQRASWGMQFGNPQFLVFLCTLIALISLNLFGVFEITAGGGLMGSAGEYSAREGKAGAFFNGVLATLLATPCTAPYLGSALGFAFTQPPLVIVWVFVAIGLGLAAPYVVLCLRPDWLRFIPKPGLWMVRFKVAMGFPMLATAVWLFLLAAGHYGKRSLWLGFFLVLMALAAWVYGEFVQRGRSRKGLALGIVVLLVGIGYFYALENQLRWRSPVRMEIQTGSLQETPEGIPWQRWSPEAVAQARAAGKVVFVDFTADWCVTCNANKRLSIEIPSVREKLRLLQAVSLLADYTKVSPEITAELNRHGRAGVPLVLVYPRQSDLPPLVLPELLTPQMVLQALDTAAR